MRILDPPDLRWKTAENNTKPYWFGNCETHTYPVGTSHVWYTFQLPFNASWTVLWVILEVCYSSWGQHWWTLSEGESLVPAGHSTWCVMSNRCPLKSDGFVSDGQDMEHSDVTLKPECYAQDFNQTREVTIFCRGSLAGTMHIELLSNVRWCEGFSFVWTNW